MGTTDEASRPLEGVTGVVLAGGGSTRMGTGKAALPMAGEPLLARVVRGLRVALAEVIVVGPADLSELVPDTVVVPDARPGMGPLGGLETALQAAHSEHIFAIACDMPFVQPALVRAMSESALREPDVDVVVLRTERGTEQLHAVYARSCLPVIERQLGSGDLTLRHVLRQLRVREVSRDEAARYDPAALSAFNANTPEEWARALQLAENANI